MTEAADRLPQYLEHLHARLRLRQSPSTASERERSMAPLPADLSALSSREPDACLDLIVRALAEPIAPELIAAIGDGLLDDLLNEKAGILADQVSELLRRNKKFRQAFGFVHYASVDPAVIEDWVAILQRLGTTKERERKSTWKRASTNNDEPRR